MVLVFEFPRYISDCITYDKQNHQNFLHQYYHPASDIFNALSVRMKWSVSCPLQAKFARAGSFLPETPHRNHCHRDAAGNCHSGTGHQFLPEPERPAPCDDYRVVSPGPFARRELRPPNPQQLTDMLTGRIKSTLLCRRCL